MTSTPNLTLV